MSLRCRQISATRRQRSSSQFQLFSSIINNYKWSLHVTTFSNNYVVLVGQNSFTKEDILGEFFVSYQNGFKRGRSVDHVLAIFTIQPQPGWLRRMSFWTLPGKPLKVGGGWDANSALKTGPEANIFHALCPETSPETIKARLYSSVVESQKWTRRSWRSF